MSEFVFATAQYDSGDWDSAPLVPANVIDSVARYTSIDVAPTGIVVPLSSPSLFRYPLIYLTGHLPVRFSPAERTNLQRFAERGGLLFVDDHNHDIDGVFHKTATEELCAHSVCRVRWQTPTRSIARSSCSTTGRPRRAMS